MYTTGDVEQAIQIVFSHAGGVADGELRVRAAPGRPGGRPTHRRPAGAGRPGRPARAHPAGARLRVPGGPQGLARGLEVLRGALLGHALPRGQVLVPADAARGAPPRRRAAAARRRCARRAAPRCPPPHPPATKRAAAAGSIPAASPPAAAPQVVRAYYTRLDAQSQSAVRICGVGRAAAASRTAAAAASLGRPQGRCSARVALPGMPPTPN
jgi:hypothetical protein